MKMKIAVTGYRGRLGSELLRQECIPLTADIRDYDKIAEEIRTSRADVVINCATKSQVDRFEEPKFYVDNMDTFLLGVSNLCFITEMLGIKLIHISTDYVFNGNKGAYSETKQLGENPVNNYGWCKLGSEIVVQNAYREHELFITIRTTGLYSEIKQNDFFDLVITSLENKKELKVTSELFGNQTYIPHLAEGLIYISENHDIIRKHDVLHIASQDVMSRYDFALMIANVFGHDPELLKPVKNKDIGNWIAKRPKKAGLLTSKAEKLGVPIYSVLDGLKAAKSKLS
jgi:dTDP-4-dehydrorhamnose reductase